MSAKASYQQIREQLINLSVDLEDKAKVCSILEQKSRDERHMLGLVEAEYENKYQSIIEVTQSAMLLSHSHSVMLQEPISIIPITLLLCVMGLQTTHVLRQLLNSIKNATVILHIIDGMQCSILTHRTQHTAHSIQRRLDSQ